MSFRTCEKGLGREAGEKSCTPGTFAMHVVKDFSSRHHITPFSSSK